MRTMFVILGFLAATGPAFGSMPKALAQQLDRPHPRAYTQTKHPKVPYSRSRSSKGAARSNS
jgi:hypothetical protein